MLDALAREPDPHTTVSDPEQAVDIHVADSLTGLEVPEVRSASWIADVGSGAGFPGLALAVALPRARVDMIESASRKCAVIDRLTHAAGLDNEIVRAMPMRAEERAAWGGRESYDVVTARAVAALPVLVEYASPLVALGGVFVAWKGARDADEESRGAEAAVEVGLEPEAVVEVHPWPEARERHLVVYRKVSPAPARFPRRPGMAGKRPLA
ncbi:MAG TPA: 16S rRNA (guanine(527)-N(7))-methyltransferase RsmG [Thermoleophilaceae bacterium]|nr:16S rRNA (guanine(527)-N(7))-methyltransferase RsmG [Thermoleophilaceae bacterium]